MKKTQLQWTTHDFSAAMTNAINHNASPKYLRRSEGKITFNGFWRGGDKQNICMWLDRATWHDAKTGQGGGCKEFAQIAFNMTLPQFMDQFGHCLPEISRPKISRPKPQPKSLDVDSLWRMLLDKDAKRIDVAGQWLENERGFETARTAIASGFANLHNDDVELFDPSLKSFVAERLSLGPHVVAPIRGRSSTKVQNLLFRTLNSVEKSEKSRLLPNAGGWSEADGKPRAFGFPSLIPDFPNLIICEGMADYFAVECLLDGECLYLPIGALSASALLIWAQFLIKEKYAGHVVILHQLDEDESGRVSTGRVGLAKAGSALKELWSGNVKATLFNWPDYLKLLRAKNPHIRLSLIKDIADCLNPNIRHGLSLSDIAELFRLCLR